MEDKTLTQLEKDLSVEMVADLIKDGEQARIEAEEVMDRFNEI